MDLIEQFRENQTLTNIQKLKNAGIGLRILKNNKWEEFKVYKLPFDRFVALYNDNFEPFAIGIY
jgi:hypothetical protein